MVNHGFSWLTDEGTMFMTTILPARDTYNFDPGDRLAAYAQAHGLKMHGHALLDPHSTPSWLATGYANNTISKQEAQTIFDNYVTTVIGHYCGKVASWDIVNEPFSSTGQASTARTPARQPIRTCSGTKSSMAPDVDRALTLARQTCPQTKRFLNDYGIEWQHNNENPKAAKIVPELQRLKNLGLLDGIGFEGHFHRLITLAYVKEAMDLYSSLGLQVAFSELDLRMVNATPHPDPNNAGKTADLSTADLNEQASIYGALAKFCQDNPRCTRFGVWGIDDELSWINAYLCPRCTTPLSLRCQQHPRPQARLLHGGQCPGDHLLPPYAGPPGQIGNLTAVPNTLTSTTIAWTTQNLGNSQVFEPLPPGC